MAQDYNSSEAQRFRELRDQEFRNPVVSPLLPADLVKFEGLKYFAIDANYLIKASFTKTTEEKSFLMPTSTGSSRKYLKIGVLSFKLDGTEFSLSAFTREYPPNDVRAKDAITDLFVPFRDLTNGKETYSGGRYLYLRRPKESEAILDFNLSHNPSCAYGNESFACTLAPKENFLPVEIRAGEKKFYSGSAK